MYQRTNLQPTLHAECKERTQVHHRIDQHARLCRRQGKNPLEQAAAETMVGLPQMLEMRLQMQVRVLAALVAAG
jgi:hypothetical protein